MSPKTDLDIRRMAIADLVPAPYNPRKQLKPGDPAYEKLAASIRTFGLVEPLVWNEITGHIVGGHARLRILKDMGVADVPVSVVRLSPEQEKALNVILNNREAQGRFDHGKLADLLTELKELPEFGMTGFDKSDLNALKLAPVGDLPEEPDADQVEIILRTSQVNYERLSPRLDELVREFDLECHVRGVSAKGT